MIFLVISIFYVIFCLKTKVKNRGSHWGPGDGHVAPDGNLGTQTHVQAS